MDAPKGKHVDHIDGNVLDCRKQNLRFASSSENNQNSRKKRAKHATSKFKGVYWDKQLSKFRARIYHKGKNHHIGLFDNEVDAALAYNKKAVDFFAPFAYLNTVEETNIT